MSPGLDDLFIQDAVAHGIECCKAQVLKFQANAVYAQALGYGRIDLKGFPGYAPPFGRIEGGQGAHVMQPISQFHDDHADIIAHGHQHLAKVMGLGFRMGIEFNLRQFTDAVYQFRDALAEPAHDFFFIGFGILDDIMQDSCSQGLVIHVHVAKNTGYFQGVADIRLAAFAMLTLVRGSAELIGAAYFLDLVGGEVAAYPFFKFRNGSHKGKYNLHFRKKGQNPARPGAGARLTRVMG